MDLLILLIVFLPFAAAFFSYGIGRKSKESRNFFVLATATVTLIFSVALLVGGNGSSAGVNLALRLTFRADGFRSLYAVVMGAMWTATSAFSLEYFSEHYKNRNRYYFFLLLTLGAAVGVFLSSDLLTAFIFFEILSFTSFTWVIHDETPRAVRAAETYLAVAVIGGLVLFMGLALLYHTFGTLNIESLSLAAAAMEDKSPLYAAGFCVLFGFGCKAGMFPVHIWLPKAHPVAPAPASALLSGALTKIGVYGILAVSISLFKGDRFFGDTLLVIALITMFLGALLAVFSVDLKRTLACSSMSQIGFILLGIALSCALGEEGDLAAAGTVAHMVNHSALKLALFMGAGAVYMNLHELSFDKIRGFGRGKPLLACVFAFGGLGLGGIPLFNGYLSKTMLHEAITEYAHLTGSGWVTAAEWIFMLTGGMTLAYMTKVFVVLFIDKPSETVLAAQKRFYVNAGTAAVLAVSAALIPLLGVPYVMKSLLCGAVGFAGGKKVPSPAFFSWEALSGALVTLAVAAFVYFVVIRLGLMRQGSYPERWPQKLDLEDALYRPLLLKWLPTAGGKAARVLAKLPDRLFAALPWLLGGIFRAVCELPDLLLALCRRTFLGELKPKKPHVGSAFTETMGHLANRVTGSNQFVMRFARWDKRFREAAAEVGAGFSFALILTCLGLCVTLVVLLLY